MPTSDLLFPGAIALGVLRTLIFAAAVGVAALAALSTAVRTRRLNPFGPAGRLTRRVADPVFAPMERSLVRAGGRPTHAPWWTLAVVVVGGLALLSLLGFVLDQLAFAAGAVGAGPRGVIVLLVRWTFALLQFALIARVLSSWIRLGPWSKWVRWAYALTDWFMRPLQQVVPPLGMLDITPIVAYFGLSLLEPAVLRLVAF